MIYECEICYGDFFEFKMDSLDEWNFREISDLDINIICKGGIYKILYDSYRKKVFEMKELVDNW